MNAHHIYRSFLALVLALLVGACTEDTPVNPPASSNATAKALIPVAYYHVQDADGTKGQGNIDVMFIFEPAGKSLLYMARPTAAIARFGTYRYEAGKLSLKYDDQDMKVDATFGLDTANETVTMPFAIFSDKATSSTWRRRRITATHGLTAIFMALSIGKEMPAAQAIERSKQYVQAYIESRKEATGAGKRTGLFDPELTGVEATPSGVRLSYDNGPAVVVQLFSAGLNNGSPLSPSTLASDPRVHLDPVPPKDGTYDPIERTALLIRPMDEARPQLLWYRFDFLNKNMPRIPIDAHFEDGKWNKTEDTKAVLEKAGYSVRMLTDEEASIANIIDAIEPGVLGKSHVPGFIAFMSIGSTDGALLSGTMVGFDSNMPEVWSRWRQQLQDLKVQGYESLLTYGGGTADNPATIELRCTPTWLKPERNVVFIALKPLFWKWLRERRNANFDRSLFYAGASWSAATPALREAIQARAFFGFKESVSYKTVGGLLLYTTKHLARHTHSAEEAYYNALRVLNTRQYIYKEDRDLEGLARTGDLDSAQFIFQGYGFDGSKVISYLDGGWLRTGGSDPGAIWWVLFAGRWGTDARKGVEELYGCWEIYWKRGKLPGLADPGCHNAAPGRAPKQDEFAYATYLLRGQPTVGFSGTLMPRWTLNDGR